MPKKFEPKLVGKKIAFSNDNGSSLEIVEEVKGKNSIDSGHTVVQPQQIIDSLKKTRQKKKVNLTNNLTASHQPVVKFPTNAVESSSNWHFLSQSMGTSSKGHFKTHVSKTAGSSKGSEIGTCQSSGAIPAGEFLIRKSNKKSKICAIDCEMVGVGPKKESALARVSIVNEFGEVEIDKYVKPKVSVTDYRTAVSGIRKEDLESGASEFDNVMREVAELLKGRIVVGHAIKHDFKALLINAPRSMVRDTSVYFKEKNGGRTPSLRNLTKQYLNITIQEGEHDSVADAKATMRLYLLVQNDWEHRNEEKKRILFKRDHRRKCINYERNADALHPDFETADK